MLPKIAILIITYNRYNEIKKVKTALDGLVEYDRDRIQYIVTDDCSDTKHIGKVSKLKLFHDTEFNLRKERGGWGKNTNDGINYILENHPDIDYVLQVEDDYVLQRTLDLHRAVALLETKPHVGMLRFRGTAGTHCVYHQFESNVSEIYPDYNENYGQTPGRLTYLQLDGGSPTLYIYSNGPHFKRIRNGGFHEFYGIYPEGEKLGITEEMYAHHVKDLMKTPNAPGIAIFPDWVHMHWDHIGITWKDTEDDI